MFKWWQDPRLDDEGTYDYYAEPLPKDYAKWDFSKHKWKCDECGKDSHIRFVSEHYFYCWDGWDSMSQATCWRCMLKDRIRSVKFRLKRKFKTLKTAREFQKSSSAGNFKYWYNFAQKLER